MVNLLLMVLISVFSLVFLKFYSCPLKWRYTLDPHIVIEYIHHQIYPLDLDVLH